MTYEEALKVIEKNLSVAIHDNDGFDPEYEQEQVNGLKLAKQAIEKQIPKEHHHIRVITVNADIRESVCPSCLGVIATNKEEYPKYCTWCGQAIDWSE